jgi:hypothetical protein
MAHRANCQRASFFYPVKYWKSAAEALWPGILCIPIKSKTRCGDPGRWCARVIKEWFSSDNLYGQESVYPATEALEFAKAEEPQNADKPAEPVEAQAMKNEPAEHSDPTIPPVVDQPLQQAGVQQRQPAAAEAPMATDCPKLPVSCR